MPVVDSNEWGKILEFFTKSSSVAELKAKVDIKQAYDWWEGVKKDRYEKFLTEMNTQIRGFEAWFANRSSTSRVKPRLKGEAKKELLDSKNQLQWMGAVLVVLKNRAMQGKAIIGQEVKEVTEGNYAINRGQSPILLTVISCRWKVGTGTTCLWQNVTSPYFPRDWF